MSVSYPADIWGLTWSGRWHLIDPDRRGWLGTPHPSMSRCGLVLYHQDEIRKARPGHLRRLKAILDDLIEAPECKKCAKSVAHGV